MKVLQNWPKPARRGGRGCHLTTVQMWKLRHRWKEGLAPSQLRQHPDAPRPLAPAPQPRLTWDLPWDRPRGLNSDCSDSSCPNPMPLLYWAHSVLLHFSAISKKINQTSTCQADSNKSFSICSMIWTRNSRGWDLMKSNNKNHRERSFLATAHSQLYSVLRPRLGHWNDQVGRLALQLWQKHLCSSHP